MSQNPYAAPQAKLAEPGPRRWRRKLLYAGAAVLVLAALLLSLGNRGDATPQAKMSEVALLLSSLRGELHDRCAAKSLPAGATNQTLGLPSPHPLGRLVQDVQVSVAERGEFTITVTLADIHLDVLPFWRTVAIPAGSKMVLAGACDRQAGTDWALREATFPARYVPPSFRRQ
jgi:hypothetical protein